MRSLPYPQDVLITSKFIATLASQPILKFLYANIQRGMQFICIYIFFSEETRQAHHKVEVALKCVYGFHTAFFSNDYHKPYSDVSTLNICCLLGQR